MSNDPSRTVEQRQAAMLDLARAAEQISAGFRRAAPTDVLSLRELEESLVVTAGEVMRLIDEASAGETRAAGVDNG